MENILTLTVNSTHFYLIDIEAGPQRSGAKLLVDAGWDLARFTAQLKAYQIPFSTIRYLMFTHHHPDHAGLIQSIKNASGARLILHEKQIPFLKELQGYLQKQSEFVPIQVGPNDLVSPDRAALHALGIQAEILATPGHSPDSVSLLLDSGAAFIGDLPLPDRVGEADIEPVRASWKTLLDRDARWFYPAHAAPFPASALRLPGG